MQYHKASVVSCYLLYFNTVCSKSVSARVRKYTREDHNLFSGGGGGEEGGGVALGLHKTNKSAPVFFNLVISPVISTSRVRVSVLVRSPPPLSQPERKLREPTSQGVRHSQISPPLAP